MSALDSRERLQDIYQSLYTAYGPQRWWPAETPFEVIVGAILVQSATWRNVERAITSLKSAGKLSPDALLAIDEERLASLIRPSGYFNAKARKLKAFVDLLYERFGGDLNRLLATPTPELRPLLLATHGIGPETADSIVLYAAGQPVFVIDAYTRRIFSRLGFPPNNDSYGAWQATFTGGLPADAAMFNEYHALIVRHGKERCRKRPQCGGCPLFNVCTTGQASVNKHLPSLAVTA